MGTEERRRGAIETLGRLPKTMWAQVYYGPGDLRLESVPLPLPGPGEILVQVGAALTCGTDLKAYRRGHRLFKPGTPFGHEFAGTIVAVGEGVEGFRVGDRVVAANSAPCGTCYYCRQGQTNLCERLEENLLWGAYAEYVRVPAPIVRQNTLPIPEEMADEVAALVEPLACVVLGMEAAAIQPGESVVIVGGTGPIGLMWVRLARAAGADPVVAVARRAKRLPAALEMGATHAYSAVVDDVLGAVRELTEGRGADVVIEAAGAVEAWELALELVRKGGRVIFFGGPPSGTSVPVNTGQLHYGELSLKGVFHHRPHTVRRALDLLRKGEIPAERLLSGEISLAAVPRGLELMAAGLALKWVIRP